MEDSRWIRLTTVGLILAALAIGYFLLTGRLTSNSASQQKSQAIKAIPSVSPNSVLGQNTQNFPAATPSTTSSPAYSRIAQRTQGNVQTLPNTGFPVALIAIVSASAAISGWGLKKFPH